MVRLTGLLALGAALAACSDSITRPSVPDAAPSLDVGLQQVATGGRASGHADVQATPVQGIQDERYSFTAVTTDAFPLAKGQVEVHFLTFTSEQITVHAEVTCLSVVGNQAWVGSRVTRYVLDGEEVPGRIGGPMIFRVLDGGEGKDATDVASLVFFGAPPGGDIAHCSTRPEFPLLRPSTIGNIQVKPE